MLKATMVQTVPSSNPLAPRLKLVCLLCAGTVLFSWQLRHPFIRFAWPILNHLAGFALALGLPWRGALEILQIQRWWSAVVVIAGVLPLTLYSLFVLLSFAMVGVGRSAQIPWNGSWVCLYDIDGGATTGVDVVIQHEKTVFPGVRLVRIVSLFADCYVQVTPTKDGIAVTSSGVRCKDPVRARIQAQAIGLFLGTRSARMNARCEFQARASAIFRYSLIDEGEVTKSRREILKQRGRRSRDWRRTCRRDRRAAAGVARILCGVAA
jgi:hypothetical protein